MKLYYAVFFMLVCATCLFQGCGTPSTPTNNASKIGVVGLKTTTMNYFAASQRGSNWCWAASIQMALSAKGINVSQETVVRNAFGVLIDRPGSPRDILANLNKWTFDHGGHRIRVTREVGFGPPSFELLKHQLESGTPVIVGYENPGLDVGHAVVVTAVIYEITAVGPEIRRVMVRDPSPALSSQQGKRELTAQEFDRVTDYYVIKTTNR